MHRGKEGERTPDAGTLPPTVQSVSRTPLSAADPYHAAPCTDSPGPMALADEPSREYVDRLIAMGSVGLEEFVFPDVEDWGEGLHGALPSV